MVSELTATGLSFEYEHGLPVVDALDLSVAPGGLTCVLGPNGAGKSTLLRLLGGLLEPTAGEVHVEGVPIASLSDRERARRIALVPQSLLVLPEVTVGDFVLGGRYVHFSRWGLPAQEDREVVRECLRRTGVEELAERSLWQLSGGQRQRVVVARSLAQGAPFLLVDEPTASLDPDHQLQVFELLAELAESGHAVLVVTHGLNLASQFASRIHLMKDGALHATGGPCEVLVPETLAAVYGPNLHVGRLPGPDGERPFVLPWIGDRPG